MRSQFNQTKIKSPKLNGINVHIYRNWVETIVWRYRSRNDLDKVLLTSWKQRNLYTFSSFILWTLTPFRFGALELESMYTALVSTLFPTMYLHTVCKYQTMMLCFAGHTKPNWLNYIASAKQNHKQNKTHVPIFLFSAPMILIIFWLKDLFNFHNG